MLTQKVYLFNKLLKLSFFYRVTKKTGELYALGPKHGSVLFNLDILLYFMFKLAPFFLTVVKKQGGVFFIGIKLILLKWFQSTLKGSKQEAISIWKGGTISNFFRVRVWAELKTRQSLNNLPVAFIFLNFDDHLNAFNEILPFNLPIIGMSEKTLHPGFVYSLVGLKQTFFINCFFFKLLSQFFKHLR